MTGLNLTQTLCLAGGLVLSLVLPLTMGAIPLQNTAQQKAFLRIVWSGQLSLAAAGLIILLLPTTFNYSGAFAIASCSCCAFLFSQKLRATI